jgi:hypothetical protein
VAVALSAVCFGLAPLRAEDNNAVPAVRKASEADPFGAPVARQARPRAQHPAEAKIREALNGPTVIDFVETPLQDVIDYLIDAHQIPIQVHKRAFDDAGIGTDTPITRHLRGNVSLASALNLILSDLDLTYVIGNEVLLITTEADARTRTVLRTYEVSDLVDPMQYAEQLADVIRTAVIKPAIARAQPGGPGGEELPPDDRRAIITFRNTLIVRETERVHAEIEALLAELRAHQGDRGAEQP